MRYQNEPTPRLLVARAAPPPRSPRPADPAVAARRNFEELLALVTGIDEELLHATAPSRLDYLKSAPPPRRTGSRYTRKRLTHARSLAQNRHRV